MRNAWIAVLMLMGGCCTPTPPFHRHYMIGVPTANAQVWLLHAGKMAADGNSYTIQFYCSTNCGDASLTNSGIPRAYEMWTDLHTNSWPYKRNHIDLSLDGGQTWPRRIGYGVNCDPNKYGGTFIWSPPADYSLMSTNAVLRICGLDEQPWPQRSNPMPYDLAPGSYLTSPQFCISAIHVTCPVKDSIVYASTPATVTWMQSGAGPVIKVYWISPDTVQNFQNQYLGSFSNCVEMVWQSQTITMPAITMPQCKLILKSASDWNNIGYSKAFAVE